MSSSEKKHISIDQFKEIEMTVGRIESAVRVPETDKLIRLSVDLGETDESGATAHRQIISGIAGYFSDVEELVGKKCIFVSNLAPRAIRGEESNGMILAATAADGTFALIVPETDLPAGTRIS